MVSNEVNGQCNSTTPPPDENDDGLQLQREAGEIHDEEKKNSSSWIKIESLARGAYGSVYVATRKGDKEENKMVIKEAEMFNAASLVHEEKLLTTRLVSPFVVRCYGHEIVRGVKNKYNLVLEYCSGNSLAHLIKQNGGGLWEKDVKVFAKDILQGLQYIHGENIIHCDVKPENIFLIPVDKQTKPNGFVTKIGDFGVALEKGSREYGDGSGHDERGTTRYMAPELIKHGIVDYGVDTWAFGCTVLEMFTGKKPWREQIDLDDSVDLVSLIGQSCLVPYIPDWLSEKAQDFLERCLVREPGERWEIGALLNHPFLNLDIEDNGFAFG